MKAPDITLGQLITACNNALTPLVGTSFKQNLELHIMIEKVISPILPQSLGILSSEIIIHDGALEFLTVHSTIKKDHRIRYREVGKIKNLYVTPLGDVKLNMKYPIDLCINLVKLQRAEKSKQAARRYVSECKSTLILAEAGLKECEDDSQVLSNAVQQMLTKFNSSK